MKKIYTTLIVLAATLTASAQGWPANYDGVMLQGFYWNSYTDSKLTRWHSSLISFGFRTLPMRIAHLIIWDTIPSIGSITRAHSVQKPSCVV